MIFICKESEDIRVLAFFLIYINAIGFKTYNIYFMMNLSNIEIVTLNVFFPPKNKIGK